MFKRSRVFLDTEVFVGECFNFDSTKLSEIRRLASTGNIQVLTTKVTIKETKRRIDKMLRAARNALKDKKLRFTLSILQQTSVDCSVLRTLDVDVLSRELEEKFDKFLVDCKAEIVDASDISAEVILDSYFAEQPPFGAQQKKDQFPDAVAIAALDRWQAKNKGQLFVVSNDPDLSSAFNNRSDFLALNNISEFLDQHNKNAKDLADFVIGQIQANSDDIKEEIKEQFLDLGFILVGEEGEIEDVDIHRVELGAISIVVLHDGSAIAELDAKVRFSAVAHYDDPNSGYYDRETGMSYWTEKISRHIVREEARTVEVEVFWNEEEVTIESVYIGSQDIEVDV